MTALGVTMNLAGSTAVEPCGRKIFQEMGIIVP